MPAEPARSAGEMPVARRRLWLAAIFLLAVAVRIVHLWQMSDELIFQLLISDPRQYDQWAQEIVAGNWLGDRVFYQTPLYPYLLAVVYTVAGHSIWAVRIAQAAFGALAAVFVAQAGARFFSQRAGLCAGLLLAIYPPAIFFDGILQKASIDLLFMSGLVWLLGVTQDRPRRWLFASIGALVGLMTLNRENAAALVPVLLVWVGWLAWPSRGRGLAIGWGAFLVGAAVVLLPVGARNYYVGGMFALTTSQMGPNFYIGNHAGASGSYENLRAGRGDPRFEAQDARELAEQALKRPLTAQEVSQYWMNRTLDDIRANPAAWLSLLVRKWLLTWNATELIDAESLYTQQKHSTPLAVLTPLWNFGTLCALALLGIWWTRRDSRRIWILYAILLAMAAAVALFYVFARYRYPLVPPLMLLAGAGIIGAYERLRRDSTYPAWETLVGAAIMIAAGLICNQPVARAYADDAVTYLNYGNEFFTERRATEAERLWRMAAAADPQMTEPCSTLGWYFAEGGRLDEAEQQFIQGLRVGNDQRFALYLAVVAAERGDGAPAREQIAAALQAQPSLAPALPGLADEARRRGLNRGAEVLLQAAAAASNAPASP